MRKKWSTGYTPIVSFAMHKWHSFGYDPTPSVNSYQNFPIPSAYTLPVSPKRFGGGRTKRSIKHLNRFFNEEKSLCKSDVTVFYTAPEED